jgi:PiT family inorganic phosphate transporter
MEFLHLFLFLPPILLGVVMGGNDAGNILGPTVGNGIFRARKAVFVVSVFVIIGAIIGGLPGMRVASGLVKVTTCEVIIINLSSAIVTLFFLLNKLPISMTQAIVGANVGVGILTKNINTQILFVIVLAWFLTPPLAYVFSFVFFKLFSRIFKLIKSLQLRNMVLRLLLWGFTLYGAYSLGANNAGKITGILYNRGFNLYFLLLVSGVSLAVGILSFGERTIYTVGRSLIKLDDFSAMIVISSSAFSIWFFSLLGLPISAAHAMIGSILGVSGARGTKIEDKRVLQKIFFSWLEAPLYSGIFSAMLLSIYKLLW